MPTQQAENRRATDALYFMCHKICKLHKAHRLTPAKTAAQRQASGVTDIVTASAAWVR
jgi:hypothetical protein